MHSAAERRSRVTSIFRDGSLVADPDALERLVPVVYEELRDMARQQLRRERSATLQTTALVHEAYIKLAGEAATTSRGRAYFFAAAATAMRQVLVDHARRRNAQKRGGGVRLVTLGADDAAVDAYAEEIVAIDEALRLLAQHSPRQAHVVECRFFAGMSVEETAQALDVSRRTVEADWALARAWLYQALAREDRQ